MGINAKHNQTIPLYLWIIKTGVLVIGLCMITLLVGCSNESYSSTTNLPPLEPSSQSTSLSTQSTPEPDPLVINRVSPANTTATTLIPLPLPFNYDYFRARGLYPNIAIHFISSDQFMIISLITGQAKQFTSGAHSSIVEINTFQEPCQAVLTTIYENRIQLIEMNLLDGEVVTIFKCES